MSYDLMVFVPEAAPQAREEFLDWYRQVTRWEEPHSYSDPAHTAPVLHAWYREMIETFPAMNGPDAVGGNQLGSRYISDYSCASNAIYIAFAWSLQEEAYRHVLMCAAKHRVGFFDVSATDGAVWLPTLDGYHVAHGGGAGDQDVVKRVAEWFKSRS